MEINANEKVKIHLDNLKNNVRVGQARIMNEDDVKCIEKILEYCKGDLNQIIDTEIIFSNTVR